MADESLAGVVLDLAENDPDFPDHGKLLVMAALEGDDALTNLLDAEDSGNPPTAPAEQQTGQVNQPIGAYLSSIEVAGFRGIGTAAKLDLHPGPGLTVIAGRNGSGKSSFAEALELSLTGESYRWKNRAVQWTSAWRNLNQPDPCSIRIGLAEEGEGLLTIGVDWAPGAELGDRKAWTQRPGAKRKAGTGSLGWDSPLELYRPILSYEELGGLLDARPLDLYQALERLLGLEQVNDASRRLDAALKRMQQPEAEAKANKAALRAALEDSDDERAPTAVILLRKHKPDLDELSKIAIGTGNAGDGIEALRELTQRSLPSPEAVGEGADALRSAAATLAGFGDVALSLVERRNALLHEALALHAEHGDMACPVCGDASLDQSWRQRVSTQLTDDSEQLASLRAARAALTSRRQDVQRLVESVPPFQVLPGAELATMERARVAHERWRAIPADDHELPDHVVTAYGELDEAFAQLRNEAEARLREREDAWAPLARRLSNWVDLMREARTREGTTKELQRAAKWIKDNAGTLRNQRLAPLAEEARKIWARLRQESNVDLGAITLEGQGNRRHVALRAEVDGKHAGALGVMSQGELHALALALFLPRASRPESPLRFVVLDDPVQAMDPAKIDGFVRVLSDLAADRQVVVFSHDDRLAEVVRRTADNARIIEVTRETGSRVFLSRSLSPALRYADDARELAKDEYVPSQVKAQVLPGLCRLAVEAAAREAFYRNRLFAGQSRAAAEAAWTDATRTSRRVALALHGNASADITSWLDGGQWRKSTLGVCTSGAHQGLRGDPTTTAEKLKRTVEDLLRGQP